MSRWEDTLRHEAVDLMQGIIVNLGDANEGADNEILHLMNTLLSDEISADQKKKVLKEDFNIAMTEELESGMSEMCNLSQGILGKGVEKGKNEQTIIKIGIACFWKHCKVVRG